MPKKNGARSCGPCGCQSSNPTVPNCACSGQSEGTWTLQYYYKPNDVNIFPESVTLSFSANRPDSADTTYDYLGSPWYTAGSGWGPAWYGPGEGSGTQHTIWMLRCQGNTFRIEKRGTTMQGPGPGGRPYGEYWSTASLIRTNCTFTVGNTGPDTQNSIYGVYDDTYAAGPNTCCYFYGALWGGEQVGGTFRPYDGVVDGDNPAGLKRGSEWVLSCGGGGEQTEMSMASVGPMMMTSSAPPMMDSSRIAMDADLCRWASGPCGCGGPSAPPRICSHPGRPREVRRPDCLHCVTLADWHGR